MASTPPANTIASYPPIAHALDGSEDVPVWQDGGQKKATASQIVAFASDTAQATIDQVLATVQPQLQALVDAAGVDAANAAAAEVLAGHFANDATDVAVPGQPDPTARGGQFWYLQAQASALAIMATLGALLIVTPRYGSLQMPFENGENKAGDNGMLYLPNSQGLFAAPFATGDFTIHIIVDLPIEQLRGMNRGPVLLGTDAFITAGTNRSFSLTYHSPLYGGGSDATRNRLLFNIRGESGASANWQITSDPMPANWSGRGTAIVRSVGGTAYVNFYDAITGVATICSAPVAQPAGWAGISLLTHQISIGGARPDVFPFDDSSGVPGIGTQNMVPLGRMAVRDVLFVDAAMTDSQIWAIQNGADPVATVTPALRRYHAPLVDANGNLTLVATTNQVAFAAPNLVQLGNIYPGPTLKRETTAKYLTIDRLPFPACAGLEHNAQSAMQQLTGSYGGLTGQMQARILNSLTQVVRDWHPVAFTAAAGRFATAVELPDTIHRLQIQLRFTSDMTGAAGSIAVTHRNIQVCPVLVFWSQSEGLISTVGLSSSNTRLALGTLSPLATMPACDISTVNFATFDRGGGPALISAQWRPGLVGDAGITIANYIRQRTQRPVLILIEGVGGTKVAQLLNDADLSTPLRKWSDATALAALMSNRGPRGEYIASAHIYGGWEYSDGQTDMKQIFDPFILGVGSAYIPQANINHYLYNGEFSLSAPLIMLPNNRQLTAGANQTSDRSVEADQRDFFRSYSATYGYVLAPETTLHKVDPSAPYTHPVVADPEGDVEMATANAEALCLGMGIGSYQGPVMFTGGAWVAGSGNLQVDLTLSGPISMPTFGYSKPGNPTGGMLATKVAGAPIMGFEASLADVLVSAGPPATYAQAYSIANVASAQIINPRTVRVTLSAPGTVGQTRIAYQSGGPGNYGAALSDDTWRAGGLRLNGWPVAGSNVPITV